MSDFGSVIALGGILAAGFVYVWRRERSRAAVLWTMSWVAIYSAGISVTQPFPHPVWNVIAIVLAQTFAMLLLAGSLAFAGRRTPPWLAWLNVLAVAVHLAWYLSMPRPLAWIPILVLELPLILLAGAIVWRTAQNRAASWPERMLAPAIGMVGVILMADGLQRSVTERPNALIVPWLATMLATALLQLVALIERSLARERRLTYELEQARKLETLGRLAGGVAHDFNNQLMAILGNAELLHERVDSDPIAAESLRDLEGAARHCAELTDGLLAFARRSPAEPQSVDVGKMLHEVERWLFATLPEGVTVRVSTDPGLRPALADPVQLKRALTNLAANARDALSGSGWITLEAVNVAAALESEREASAGWIEIRVRDNGVGMDDATRERIFDPFFTTKCVGKGSGLGLAVVYGTVTAHGGSIEVESALGVGTTFRLRWPAAQHQADARAPARLCVARGSETVLLADDEPAVRAITRTALELGGFQVIEAGDGHEAVRLFAEHRHAIDAALVDLAMPGRDGCAVLEALRKEEPNLPAVLMSGHIARENGMALPPGVAVLPKPFGVAQLTQAVRVAIDETRAGAAPSGAQPA